MNLPARRCTTASRQGLRSRLNLQRVGGASLVALLVTGGCQCEDWFARRRGDYAPPQLAGPQGSEEVTAAPPPLPIAPIRALPAPSPSPSPTPVVVATPSPLPSPSPTPVAEATPSPDPGFPMESHEPNRTRLRRPFEVESHRNRIQLGKPRFPSLNNLKARATPEGQEEPEQ